MDTFTAVTATYIFIEYSTRNGLKKNDSFVWVWVVEIQTKESFSTH